MCLELALEGERLCKSGDCRAGVAFFQAAIQAGTDDLRTLSAIYSQLGNAYFYLGDYTKAMQYHKHDLTLARSMNDKLGEAKSSGNLSGYGLRGNLGTKQQNGAQTATWEILTYFLANLSKQQIITSVLYH